MKKHRNDKSGQTTAPGSLPGIVSLLENDEEHSLPDGSADPCRKVSENIYQCLADITCRYKFPYESVRLCSWPKADNPERTHLNLPCSTSDDMTKG
ncbi:MAG TPA: hypothetical protein VFF53_13640 [Geobacteraceae bacterium]|nr:hypothetical protein [Geobacteraceae bacterium]